MEKNNREKKKQTATKTVGGKKRKRITITNHDADKKRSWSNLPNDILESIKKRIFFIDQVNFRRVCKSWSCVERVSSLQQIPWLLVFDNVGSYLTLIRNRDKNSETKEKNTVHSCKLVDSKSKKNYTIDVSVIKAKLQITNFDDLKLNVHESKYGWLLISQSDPHNTRLFLYSPFFSEGYNFIELPVLRNCSTFCATFTSNPLDEDCKILTLSKNVRDKTFSLKEDRDDDNTILLNTWSRQNLECKLKQWVAKFGDDDNTFFLKKYLSGQDSWSTQNLECKFKRWDTWHWIYSEGSFYYRTTDGTMGKFNLALEEWTVLPRLPPLISYRKHYKVTSSDGELFLILDECNVKKRQKRWSHESRIYRLDLSSMIWEDLDSIGDRVLFYGEGYNSVVDSSVLKLNGERKDISDMIYYCKTEELRYCSVRDFTRKLGDDEKPPGKQNCSRHYGSIATKHCRKLLIDPPPR